MGSILTITVHCEVLHHGDGRTSPSCRYIPLNHLESIYTVNSIKSSLVKPQWNSILQQNMSLVVGWKGCTHTYLYVIEIYQCHGLKFVKYLTYIRNIRSHLRSIAIFLHDRPWISPWIKSVSNELDITCHMFASQLSGHCDVIANRLWRHQQNVKRASETREWCVKILVFSVICGFVMSCKK